MGINPDALFLDLQRDLEPYLERDTVDGVSARAMVSSFYKKFVDTEAPDAEAKALSKFLSINDRMATFKVESQSDEDTFFLNALKSVLDDWYSRSDLGSLSFGQILDKGRVGPGASRLARGDDFYTKLFDSPLSCTKDSLYRVYKLYVEQFPRWGFAENLRSSIHGSFSIVEGNSMSFVPKTNDIRRSICTEPSINMIFQLGLGSWIEDCLRKQTGIDLGIQPDKNRELARFGSITGSFGTIDLESASDSLSNSMIRYILPKGLCDWLFLFRSSRTKLADQIVELNMVSTMGNGFTFPLQTLLFAAVVVTSMRFHNFKIVYPRAHRLGNFGVFGDDIIVPFEMYDFVVAKLQLLGFRVNAGKSFNTGPFRESCGYDYHNGHNVRGVYVRRLKRTQDRYILINRLLEWTAQTGIPVRRTVQHLLQTVPENPVPLAENDDCGVRTPYTFLKRRVRDKDVQSIRYTRWVADPFTLRIDPDTGKVLSPRGSRRRHLNYDGLVITALRGALVAYRIPIRHDQVRYTRRIGISPNWDWIPMGLGYVSNRAGLGMLETSFLLNCEVE